MWSSGGGYVVPFIFPRDDLQIFFGGVTGLGV